jgi:hypothetical protein
MNSVATIAWKIFCRLCVVGVAIARPLELCAQTGVGTITLANSSSSQLINGQTGNPVAASDLVQAALYWAPVGSNLFTQAGAATSVGIPLPGVFVGGTRSVQTNSGGATAQFQIKAWGGGYATYEQAIQHTGILVGQSSVLQLPTGNPAASPPTPPVPLAGLQGFTLTTNNGPSSLVLTCSSNKTVQCGTAWTCDPPIVTDACPDTNVTLSILGAVTNGSCPQVITQTWLAFDACGNTNICSQTVTAQVPVIVWTNLSGGDWNTPTNWSPNQVPGPIDDVYITNNGSYEVSVSSNSSVGNLFIGGAGGIQTLSLATCILEVSGNFAQGTNAALNLLLAGVIPGTNFAQLLIEGSASVAGELSVSLTNGFVPPPVASFDVLTAGGLSGTFTTFSYPSNGFRMQLNYTPTNVAIQVFDINVPPALPAISNQTVNAAASLTVTNTAIESDTNASVAYSLLTAPAGMRIDTNGIITWTPARSQGPSTNLVITVATNTNPYDPINPHLSATNSFNVIVFAPTLAPVNDASVNPGQTLTFTNFATDNDPSRTLTFSLGPAPVGASITPTTGIFHWRPPVSAAGTSNLVQIVVSDDSSPPLTDSNSFGVFVNGLGPVALTPLGYSNGQFTLSIDGPAGPDYVVESSTTLLDWIRLATNTPTALPFGFTDTNGLHTPYHFYRVQLGP